MRLLIPLPSLLLFGTQNKLIHQLVKHLQIGVTPCQLQMVTLICARKLTQPQFQLMLAAKA
jgi:hypothetical protein